MNDDARTPASLATPLGRLVAAATPKVRPPLIDPRRTRTAARKGGMNLKAVADVLREKGFDPTVELVKILKDPNALPTDIRARMLTTLMEYVHPKKKSVELTGAEGGPIQIENISDQALVQIIMGQIEEEEDVVEVFDSPFKVSAPPEVDPLS